MKRPRSASGRAGSPAAPPPQWWRRVLAGMLASLLLTLPSPAPALEPGATPLDVEISPSSAVTGATITIAGRSVVLGDQRQIPIRIERPDGSQRELSATLSESQSFSASFAETTLPGNYKVTVFTADRRASVDRSFTTQVAAVFRRAATERMTAAFEAMEEETEELSTTIAEAPASAPREELEERVEELKRVLADVDKYLAFLDESVAALEEAVDGEDADSGGPAGSPTGGEAAGGVPVGEPGGGEVQAREDLRELHEEMGRAADEVERQQEVFADQLAKFDYDHTLCDGLHYVQQAWASMTAALSAAKKLTQLAFGKAAKIGVELGVGAAGSAALGSAGGASPEASAVRGQLVSTAKARATDSLDGFKVLENLSKGLVDYELERLFRAVCEKYVGPFEGTMTAEVFVEQGRFYAYETKIEGELRLRYGRGSGNNQVPVTGEFEGVASSFKLDEDLWRVQPAIERDVLLRWVISPLPSRYLDSAGTFGRALLSPNYFYVPVRGMIEGDTILLQLQPARLDFTKSSTAVYVLVNLSVPFPHVVIQDIPHEGANYILTRAVREEPKFTIEVHRDEEYSEIKESFQNDASTPDNMIKVRTEVELRACNPKCP